MSAPLSRAEPPRVVLEWLWRLAVLAALGWIGLQLQRLHEDITLPVDDDANVAAASDDIQEALDALRDQLDGLDRKVDALIAAGGSGS